MVDEGTNCIGENPGKLLQLRRRKERPRRGCWEIFKGLAPLTYLFAGKVLLLCRDSRGDGGDGDFRGRRYEVMDNMPQSAIDASACGWTDYVGPYPSD